MGRCIYSHDDGAYCDKHDHGAVTVGCCGEDKCRDRKALTNADRIRAMTDEELAEWLETIRMYCANDLCGMGCPFEEICYSKADAPTEMLAWLKEEASDEN